MLYFIFAQLFSLLLSCLAGFGRSDRHKDLEILLLRQQLRLMQRHQPQKPELSRWEKRTLAVLAAKLHAAGQGAHNYLSNVALLFKPDTLLRWHRDLVRRKWTFKSKQGKGRSATAPEFQALLLQLAQENTSWGYGKLQGELLKLGNQLGCSTIRDILKRQHIPPVPERDKKGSSWRTFLGHYKQQLLACDFFTVETAWLKSLYVSSS